MVAQQTAIGSQTNACAGMEPMRQADAAPKARGAVLAVFGCQAQSKFPARVAPARQAAAGR